MSDIDTDEYYEKWHEALAHIAELEAELLLVNGVNATFRHDLEQAEARNAELEAEIERLREETKKRMSHTYVAALEAENERLKEMAGCDHPSSSGVDTTPNNNPMKMWRCDGCGFEYIEIWEPEMGLRYKEARWAERIAP